MTQDSIFQDFMGFQKSRILLTAVELGIFTQIESGNNTPEAIADSANIDRHGTWKILDTLCTIGYLRKEDGKYYNLELTKKYLVKDSPDYMSGLMHSAGMWKSWSRLTDVVKNGRVVTGNTVASRGADWIVSFIEAMHFRGVKNAVESCAGLDLNNAGKMLDVGGGSGAFAMGFAKNYKGLQSVVFDLPEVVPVTEQYIKNAGFEERVSTLAGNYHTDDIGSGYDLVFMSAVVHSNSISENTALVKKCYDATNPGGMIIIEDFVVNEDRISPPRGAIFAINMLVSTETGDTYTEKEITKWITDAGYRFLMRRNLDHGTSQIIGKK